MIAAVHVPCGLVGVGRATGVIERNRFVKAVFASSSKSVSVTAKAKESESVLQPSAQCDNSGSDIEVYSKAHSGGLELQNAHSG